MNSLEKAFAQTMIGKTVIDLLQDWKAGCIGRRWVIWSYTEPNYHEANCCADLSGPGGQWAKAFDNDPQEAAAQALAYWHEKY